MMWLVFFLFKIMVLGAVLQDLLQIRYSLYWYK